MTDLVEIKCAAPLASRLPVLHSWDGHFVYTNIPAQLYRDLAVGLALDLAVAYEVLQILCIIFGFQHTALPRNT